MPGSFNAADKTVLKETPFYKPMALFQSESVRPVCSGAEAENLFCGKQELSAILRIGTWHYADADKERTGKGCM